MPDEASTPPDSTSSPQAADTQAPPNEPVNSPAAEPIPSPEEVAPAPEPTQTETPASAEVSEPVPEPVPEPKAQPEPLQSSSPVPQVAQSVANMTPTADTAVIRPHGDLVAANAKIQETKRKKLDKIMARLSEKGRITNDEVEKLLRVSDATATRYLQTLEQENRIKQTGKTGMAVFYEKV